MMPSRRSFLQKAAVFAVTTSASIHGLTQEPARELGTSEEIGRQTLASDPQETFEKWTGGAFRVSYGGRRLGTLVLATVQSTHYPRSKQDAQGSEPPMRQPIRMGVQVPEVKATLLEFERRGKYLPQETYTVDHDWLGRFELLIEPCVYPQGTITYVAVFTRFTGQNVMV